MAELRWRFFPHDPEGPPPRRAVIRQELLETLPEELTGLIPLMQTDEACDWVMWWRSSPNYSANRLLPNLLSKIIFKFQFPETKTGAPLLVMTFQDYFQI